MMEYEYLNKQEHENKIKMLKDNLKEAERALEISQEEFWKVKDENKELRKQIQYLENELSKSNENNEEGKV